MSENPYRLARDIRGIGFKTADAIAMKLGIDKTAMIRVRAGISYALTEAMDDGHCGLPVAELAPLAEKLLDVPQELIRTGARSRTGRQHGDCRPSCRYGLCISRRSPSRRTGHRRAALDPEQGQPSLALDRSRESHPLGRAAYRLDARRQPESGCRGLRLPTFAYLPQLK
jgi:hypothetical protein